MADVSHSAWFSRFLSSFTGREARSRRQTVSRERWLSVFIESFRGERLSTAERNAEAEARVAEAGISDDVLLDWTIVDDNDDASTQAEEQRSPPQTQSREESQEAPRYREAGGHE